MNENEAQEYLSQYAFDETGLHTSTEFARHVHAWAEIPDWSKRLKKKLEAVNKKILSDAHGVKRGLQADTDVSAKIPKLFEKDKISSNSDEKFYVVHEQSVSLGAEINSGVFGIVYVDPKDENWVIKKFRKIKYSPNESDSSNEDSVNIDSDDSDDSDDDNYQPFDERLTSAKKEANDFAKYYGPETAKVIVSGDNVYIKMKKIPGEPLREVERFWDDALDKFWEMIEKLDKKPGSVQKSVSYLKL